MVETTFGIIKPDAIISGFTGQIIYLIERNKFILRRLEKITLTRDQAEQFYDIHKARPFFRELVDYMTSGPIIIMALEKEDSIKEWRELMGATDPKKAAPGTIRRMFGTSIGNNATHGSDGRETAKRELAFFFPDL
jgi:nucleoside-diphosphate kinase